MAKVTNTNHSESTNFLNLLLILSISLKFVQSVCEYIADHINSYFPSTGHSKE